MDLAHLFAEVAAGYHHRLPAVERGVGEAKAAAVAAKQAADDCKLMLRALLQAQGHDFDEEMREVDEYEPTLNGRNRIVPQADLAMLRLRKKLAREQAADRWEAFTRARGRILVAVLATLLASGTGWAVASCWSKARASVPAHTTSAR